MTHKGRYIYREPLSLEHIHYLGQCQPEALYSLAESTPAPESPASRVGQLVYLGLFKLAVEGRVSNSERPFAWGPAVAPDLGKCQ